MDREIQLKDLQSLSPKWVQGDRETNRSGALGCLAALRGGSLGIGGTACGAQGPSQIPEDPQQYYLN